MGWGEVGWDGVGVGLSPSLLLRRRLPLCSSASCLLRSRCLRLGREPLSSLDSLCTVAASSSAEFLATDRVTTLPPSKQSIYIYIYMTSFPKQSTYIYIYTQHMHIAKRLIYNIDLIYIHYRD